MLHLAFLKWYCASPSDIIYKYYTFLYKIFNAPHPSVGEVRCGLLCRIKYLLLYRSVLFNSIQSLLSRSLSMMDNQETGTITWNRPASMLSAMQVVGWGQPVGYRAGEMYDETGLLAAHIVLHEQEEEGNRIHVPQVVIEELLAKRIPASEVIWVCRTRQAAQVYREKGYGEIIEEVFDPYAVIIGFDEMIEAPGFLVLRDARYLDPLVLHRLAVTRQTEAPYCLPVALEPLEYKGGSYLLWGHRAHLPYTIGIRLAAYGFGTAPHRSESYPYADNLFVKIEEGQQGLASLISPSSSRTKGRGETVLASASFRLQQGRVVGGEGRALTVMAEADQLFAKAHNLFPSGGEEIALYQGGGQEIVLCHQHASLYRQQMYIEWLRPASRREVCRECEAQ
jgi:hypothetical protein